MKLLSICVGKPREVQWMGKSVMTGIFKDPIGVPVHVRRTNLDGDGQADLTVHGGIDKAVYAYGEDAYPWWRKELGTKDLPPGSFGENLLFAKLDEKAIASGDIFSLGACRLQASQPRFPCFKLGIKFGDAGILKTFMKSGRCGVYFRVVGEGPISVGNELKLVTAVQEDRVSIAEIFTANQGSKLADPELLERMARSSALMTEWREWAQRKLDAR